ncbi:MAG: hypothetical protein GXN97_03615 [Aquificae bacterium]|nr:hypothetical protein [Aquificota bacterium]
MNKHFDDFQTENKLIETLEAEIERGEWKSLRKEEKENLKKLLKKGAKNFEKKKPISLRISQRDLKLLKRKSLEIGIPYQTIISALIRQYVEGKIKLEI